MAGQVEIIEVTDHMEDPSKDQDLQRDLIKDLFKAQAKLMNAAKINLPEGLYDSSYLITEPTGPSIGKDVTLFYHNLSKERQKAVLAGAIFAICAIAKSAVISTVVVAMGLLGLIDFVLQLRHKFFVVKAKTELIMSIADMIATMQTSRNTMAMNLTKKAVKFCTNFRGTEENCVSQSIAAAGNSDMNLQTMAFKVTKETFLAAAELFDDAEYDPLVSRLNEIHNRNCRMSIQEQTTSFSKGLSKEVIVGILSVLYVVEAFAEFGIVLGTTLTWLSGYCLLKFFEEKNAKFVIRSTVEVKRRLYEVISAMEESRNSQVLTATRQAFDLGNKVLNQSELFMR